jgi:hypothetical protein
MLGAKAPPGEPVCWIQVQSAPRRARCASTRRRKCKRRLHSRGGARDQIISRVSLRRPRMAISRSPADLFKTAGGSTINQRGTSAAAVTRMSTSTCRHSGSVRDWFHDHAEHIASAMHKRVYEGSPDKGHCARGPSCFGARCSSRLTTGSVSSARTLRLGGAIAKPRGCLPLSIKPTRTAQETEPVRKLPRRHPA